MVALDIAPGIVVEFQEVYQIEVKGSVKAVGTESESIIFTAKDKENSCGQFFQSSEGPTNDTTEFSHGVFEYSKPFNKASRYTDGASFYLSDSIKLEISNCTFRFNKGLNSVINPTALGVSIHSNTFIKNESYCLMITRTNQGNKVYNNIFENNAGGAAIHSGVDDITLYANNLMGSRLWCQLFDIHSRTVQTKSIHANPVDIDLNGLIPGTYFLNIMNANNEIGSFVIVKKW
jgi:hypothetical protein